MRRYAAFAFVAICLGLLGLFLFQLYCPSPPIVVSRQTTYLTAPLADDGLPDYAKYLLDRQRAGVTAENNAAIPFAKAMWPLELHEEEAQSLVCAELGMRVPREKGLTSPWNDSELCHAIEKQYGWEVSDTAFDDDEENENEPVTVADLGELYPPWTRSQAPLLAAWLERHRKQIDLLHKAATRTRYYFPSPSLLSQLESPLSLIWLSDVGGFDSAIDVLCCRATLSIGERRLDDAWRDLSAAYRIVAQAPTNTSIGLYVRIRCCGYINHATLELLNHPELPPRVASEVSALLARQQPLDQVAGILDTMERLSVITAALAVSGERSLTEEQAQLFHDTIGDTEVKGCAQLSADWNAVLRSINDYFDRFAEAASLKSYAARRDAIELLEDEVYHPSPATQGSPSIFSREARESFLARTLIESFMGGGHWVACFEDWHNADLQLLQIAAALAVYRCEHGEHPETLDALIPKLLAEAPVDAYLGKQIAYTKTANGYLLVNCGPNGVDNGGMNVERVFYKGYGWWLENGDDAAICRALGEPQPEPIAEEDRPQGYLSPLQDQIDPLGDDIAIRLPLTEFDWSKIDTPENAGAANGSE